MKYIYNGFRIFMAVIFVAGGLAYVELSLFKSAVNPLGWKHFLIAIGIAAVVGACWWDENRREKSISARRSRSSGKLPRIEVQLHGTVVHHYDDGTQIEWKDGGLVEFRCADSRTSAGSGN